MDHLWGTNTSSQHEERWKEGRKEGRKTRKIDRKNLN
jgi:hypothetical protein